MVSFIFDAIRSKASFIDISTYVSFCLSSGFVKRSLPYIAITEWYPLTQQSPLFTDELGSPLTATAFPFSTPTKTPQPTPQNLQGAFFQSKSPPFGIPLSCSLAKSIPGNKVAAVVMAESIAIFFIKLRLFVVEVYIC